MNLLKFYLLFRQTLLSKENINDLFKLFILCGISYFASVFLFSISYLLFICQFITLLYIDLSLLVVALLFSVFFTLRFIYVFLMSVFKG